MLVSNRTDSSPKPQPPSASTSDLGLNLNSLHNTGHKLRSGLLMIAFLLFASLGLASAQGTTTCYQSGDFTPTTQNQTITICHTNTYNVNYEYLFYATPQPNPGTSYGQIAYNFNPVRTAPGTYDTLFHTGPQKLNDTVNCPLGAAPVMGQPPPVGIGYPGFPTPYNPMVFPTIAGRSPPNPFYLYDSCVVGDDIQQSSYAATGPSDTGPYQLINPSTFVITGQTGIPDAPNFYGGTTKEAVVRLSAALNPNIPYTSIPVAALPFDIGGIAPSAASTFSATLLLSDGTHSMNVVLAPLALGATTTNNVAIGDYVSNVIISSPGLPHALPPGAGLLIGNLSLSTNPVVTTLQTGLVKGSGYNSLSVVNLPYTIAAGTVLTLSTSVGYGQPIPQQVTVSAIAQASTGVTTISVNSFTANNDYNSTNMNNQILSPATPAGATNIPVSPLYSSFAAPAGTPLMATAIQRGATSLPTVSFQPNFAYQPGTGSSLTLQNDAGGGGTGNQMTLRGRNYDPYGEAYYYSFFIGEQRVPNTTNCPWLGNSALCNASEVLLEARATIDSFNNISNWMILTNDPSTPWHTFADANDPTKPYHATPVLDQGGNPIVGSYPGTTQGVSGLLGTMNQVYTPKDGAHTFRYFYSDHPAPPPGNTTSWQSDLLYFNLYEREAVTGDPNAFDSTGNIRWSAPQLIATNVPGSGLIDVAKAHGLNRWAVAFPDSNGLNQTTDYRIEYSTDMTGLTHDKWIDPLKHLLANLTVPGSHYLNVQAGRLYGPGFRSSDAHNQVRGYEDVISQPFYMTDPDGNITAPDNGSPGYTRGGMLTWTDFPLVYDNTQPDPNGNHTGFGTYGGKAYQASFDVSGNLTGEFATNGDFATGVFTGNSLYDGWTLFDASGGSPGTNYPPTIFRNPAEPNGQVAVVGPPAGSSSELPGGSGMYQLITVPSTPAQVTLSFSYLNQCSSNISADYQTAYVYTTDNIPNPLLTVVPASCDNSNTWQTKTVDITRFKTHPTYFYFITHKANSTGPMPVTMFLGCKNACFTVNDVPITP